MSGAAPRRRRTGPGPARRAAVTLLVMGVACTPITPREEVASSADPPVAATGERRAGRRALDVGDRAPDLVLREVAGRERLRLAAPGRTTVLTFFETSRAREDGCAELLERLRSTTRRMTDDLARAVRVVAVDLGGGDAGEAAAVAGAADGATVDWVVAAVEPEALERLAAAFGVLYWTEADGTLHHTFTTAVLDADGSVRARYAGLDEWSASELLASVASASR